ncbi:MAG TPA: hypothetical protein VFK80_01945 [Limnochordia bacterium]|nr:hypothetical protein [Limnochordia bacterium]
MKVQITPNPVRPGAAVAAEVKIEGDAAAVRSVRCQVEDQDFVEYFNRTGDGVYALRTSVPWEAPAGVYQLVVSAHQADGAVVEQARTTLTVEN